MQNKGRFFFFKYSSHSDTFLGSILTFLKSLFTALLRYYWHTVNGTYLKVISFEWRHPWNHLHNQDNEYFHSRVSSYLITVFLSHAHRQAVTDLPSVTLEEFTFSSILHKCNHIMYVFWLLLSMVARDTSWL